MLKKVINGLTAKHQGNGCKRVTLKDESERWERWRRCREEEEEKEEEEEIEEELGRKKGI